MRMEWPTRRTTKVRATRELDPAKLSPSLFSLFPPVHFSLQLPFQGWTVTSAKEVEEEIRHMREVLNR